MQPVFVITDAMLQPEAKEAADRYVTGFWDGTELISSIKDAQFYGSVSEAEEVVRDGSFYDPAVREYEYNGDYEKDEDCLIAGRFYDMARYGTA